MTSIFILQLISSFIIGGGLIATLSFAAERVNKKIAAPILSLPSTLAVSYFFIGWTVSPQAVANVVPTTILALGIILLFVITYLYISKIKLAKILSIIICSIGALAIWFVLSLPLAIYEFSNLRVALIASAVIIAIAYFFITILPKITTDPSTKKYSVSEKLGRAVFAGLIVCLAVFLAKTLSPFWGGIFAGFPAAFLSTLIILHLNHDSNFLFRTFHNVPIGITINIVYPLAVMYAYPVIGIIWGTLVSYAVSLLVLCLYHLIFKRST